VELNVAVNYLLTLFCLAGAVGFIYLFSDRYRDRFQQDKEVDLFCLSSIGLIFVAAFVLISIWLLLTTEPTEVMCRSGACSFGPYSWSLVTLSFSLALFFAVFFYVAIMRIISTSSPRTK